MYLYILLIIILVLLLCNKNKVIDGFVIKTALKKCPRVWHHFPKKNAVRYYNTRYFANPEQVCLARCRDNPDCKAAQVQYGYSPKKGVRGGGAKGPIRCWTYSNDKSKKSTKNTATAAYFKDKVKSCYVSPPPPKRVKKIVAVKKPLRKVPLKKRVLKLRKNTNCPDGLKIKSHSECWQALKKLGLFSRTHWMGKDPKVPIGCSWTNSVSAVGKSMGLWNDSLSGKARYDLHPICYRPPLAPQKTTGILKAINQRLLEKSIEKEEDPVPIALSVGVSKDNQEKVTSSQSLFKEAMSVLGDQYKINHFRDQGSGQRSKTNSDLSNHAPFMREGFDVKMTGKVSDDFKALATNAFLIDMAHLKGEDLTGVPVNLNLSLNDDEEKQLNKFS
jgi:hypothetical protein